jgi:tRNA 2-selenouridine synthase
MPVQKIEIEEFIKLSETNVVIDVRSPSEYAHAYIPNAVNIALFNDEERKVVGTTYKQQSREDAIKIGLDYFGPKMRGVVEKVEELAKGSWQLAVGKRETSESSRQKAEGSLQFEKGDIPKETDCPLPTANCILIHCWRGGMRSAAVAWLLDLYGFKVYILNGGYKAFRNFVLEQFTKAYHFNIIGGYTGSGKTYLLEAIKKNGNTIIDLEGIACHKGSALGALGMPTQPTQEMFENKLALELFEKSNLNIASETTANCIWLEDESQRIGLIKIPDALWKSMRSSVVYFLDIPFEERLQFLTKEYGLHKKEELVNAGIRIQKRLGGLETKNYINYLLENNFTEAFRILLVYYDKHYAKGLHNRENAKELITMIPAFKVDAAENLILLQEHI